jgi:iron(III) transport system ATP-binding protein
MAVAIRFENVCKAFGGTRAVDAVSLQIEPGEVFFLLGPSGCGKTTLLRCLAGFYTPEEGRIFIGERDVTRLAPHERDTGMVFQSYALWPHMSVGENVAFGLEMRKVGTSEVSRRVAEALDLVKMADRAQHKPNQLSGGQQQRVALARALVIRPQCLLLDEPLSNLDAKLRLEMRTEIRRICKESGLTAIYVTHDQKEALSVADRLAVMDAGRIRQIGRPQDVYLRPDSAFVANFIGETNFLEGEVVASAAGRLRVRTPFGELTGLAEPVPPFAAGQKVTVSVRPEAIRLGTVPGDCPNRFPATLHHTVYLGEVAVHQVSLVAAAGAEVVLKAFEMNPRLLARDASARVNVWIAPDDVVVLAR